jgi:hypothetical protein
MNNLIEPVLRPLSRFAEHSQRQACRNAMVASTALSAGRVEREEVQQFVTTMLAHRGQVATATTPPAAAQIG